MITVVIGTCIRLNYALLFLVLATVFDATAIILSSMSVAKNFIMLTHTLPSSTHLDFPLMKMASLMPWEAAGLLWI